MSKINAEKINYGNPLVIGQNGKSVVNKEISDAQIIADSIIAEARKKADEILKNAQNEAGEIVTQAISDAENSKDMVLSESKTQGFEEGYQDGLKKITEELEGAVENVNNFVKCKFEAKNRIIKSLHYDILDLVLQISEKICKTELRKNRETLIRVVSEAISMLKEKETVTIIVNPEMARKIYEISEDLRERIHSLENIKIVEDTSIAADGTIVESVGSRVDSRVSAQIEQFAQRLYTELNSTPEIELSRELDDVEGMNDPLEAEKNTDINGFGDNDKPEQI